MSTMNNANQLINTVATTQSTTTDASGNNIMGPLSSPQTPLQPPQNPLIAMTTLSTSPMTTMAQKDKPPTPHALQSQDSNEQNNSMKPPVSVPQSTPSSSVSTSTTISTTNNMLSLVKKTAEFNEAKKAASEAEAKKRAEEAQDKANSTAVSSASQTNVKTTSTMSTSVSVASTAVSGSTTTTTSTSQSENSQMETSVSDESPSKVKKGGASANNNSSVNSANVNQLSGKDLLPKAMVKPNILTHVIEGYVIQESSEPFPVNRQRYSEKENDEPPKKKTAMESPEGKPMEHLTNGNVGKSDLNVSSTTLQGPNDMVPCEKCGKVEMRSKLKKKRYCSLICARAAKNASTDTSNGEELTKTPLSSPAQGDKLKTPQSTPISSNNNSKMEVDGNESTNLPPIEEHIMMKWSVAEVCDFIKNLPGCSDYADDFAMQEIDGQALLLLKENHLVSAMGMKLGPALKIVNKIESMRVQNNPEQQQQNNSSQQQPQTPQ
jgi:polyhomeotic-like protein 1